MSIAWKLLPAVTERRASIIGERPPRRCHYPASSRSKPKPIREPGGPSTRTMRAFGTATSRQYAALCSMAACMPLFSTSDLVTLRNIKRRECRWTSGTGQRPSQCEVSSPTGQTSPGRRRAFSYPPPPPESPRRPWRRFAPPWTLEEMTPASSSGINAGQALAYVRDGARQASAAKLFSRDEARIATNSAKLPDLLRKPARAERSPCTGQDGAVRRW
jgi:hypothetical protein